MMIAASFGSVGLLLVAAAILVLNSQRRNRLQLRRLGEEVDRMAEKLRTPEERAELARRIEEIEAQKRLVFGRYDAGGG